MMKGNRPTCTEPSSDLWDLVLDMDWPRVVHHARSEPQDADFIEGHWHETPLYLACQNNPPVEAVRAIIEAHPESVRIASRENHDLPIHIACRYQADAAILEALLKHYPETAIEPTKWGLTPIMALWDFRTTTTKNNNHATTRIPSLHDDDNNKDYWDKAFVILRAVARSLSMDTEYYNGVCYNKANAYYNELLSSNVLSSDTAEIDDTNASMALSPFLVAGEEERIFFVHATVSLGAQGCPIEVLSFVMNKYRKQVFERDQWGHLPLHVAIRKVSWSKNRKRRFRPNEQPFLACLLKAHPGAARERIYSDHNRYPLHSAIANGHTWSRGVKDIFLAAPEVLLMRDSLTGLFPFQLAGVPIVGEKANDVDNLETVYQLLRTRPEVIYYLQHQVKREKKKSELLIQSSANNFPVKRTSNKQIMLFTAFAQRLFGTVPIVFTRSVFDSIISVVWHAGVLRMHATYKSVKGLGRAIHKI